MSKSEKKKKKQKTPKQLKKLQTKTKNSAKVARNSFTGLFKFPNTVWKFLKAVWQELKLVQWLTANQTIKWSSAVILTGLLLGGFIALLDWGLFNLREILFDIT